MYAIIATGGKQYKVSEGDEIFVEKLDAEEGSAVTFDQVLAVSDNALKVGADVASASVSGTASVSGVSGALSFSSSSMGSVFLLASLLKSICLLHGICRYSSNISVRSSPTSRAKYSVSATMAA